MKLTNPFDEPDSFPELTSLVDVMFLLLIFFLLTSSFEKENEQKTIEVDLPMAQHAYPIVKKSPILLGIDKSGSYIIDTNKYDSRQIYEELKARLAVVQDSTVVIYGDRSAPYHAVVYVYDLFQALGVKHFSHQVR